MSSLAYTSEYYTGIETSVFFFQFMSPSPLETVPGTVTTVTAVTTVTLNEYSYANLYLALSLPDTFLSTSSQSLK